MNQRYYDSHLIVPIIGFSYLFQMMIGLVNLSMYQEKKTNVMMVIMLSSSAFNIIANFILVPTLGIYGAAYATLLTMIFTFLIEYYIAKNYYYIPFQWGKIIPFISSLILISIMFVYVLTFDIWLSLLIKIIIVAIIAITFYKFFYMDFKVKLRNLL